MTTARLLAFAVLAVSLLTSVPAVAQTPAPPAPPAMPPYGAPIGLEAARKVIAGAEAEARKNNWNMVIVVLDPGANLVALERMDGASLGSIEVAKDKARTAILFRRPTKVFQDAVAQGGANLRLLTLTGLTAVDGGLPIVVDGKIVGAVGASGAASDQDAQCAKAGIDALSK
jgi:uncharacterized protein GlcG (DUF336 family)